MKEKKEENRITRVHFAVEKPRKRKERADTGSGRSNSKNHKKNKRQKGQDASGTIDAWTKGRCQNSPAYDEILVTPFLEPGPYTYNDSIRTCVCMYVVVTWALVGLVPF